MRAALALPRHAVAWLWRRSKATTLWVLAALVFVVVEVAAGEVAFGLTAFAWAVSRVQVEWERARCDVLTDYMRNGLGLLPIHAGSSKGRGAS